MATHHDLKISVLDVPEVFAALCAARDVVDGQPNPDWFDDAAQARFVELQVGLVHQRALTDLRLALRPLLPGVPDG
jgi:hypothetical protein